MKKMTAIRSMALGMAAIITFAACQKETDSNFEPTGDVTEATIIINTPRTYATDAGSPEENAITSLEVYVFNSNGTPDSETPYHAVSQVSKTITFAVASGANKKFIVTANTSLGGGYTNYDDFRAALINVAMNDINSRSLGSAGDFIMAGEATSTIIDSEPENQVPITISRLISKIEAPDGSSVTVDLKNDDIEDLFTDPTVTNSDITFNLDGHVVVNGLDYSNIVFFGNASGNDELPWDNSTHATWINGKTYFESQFDGSKNYTKVYSGVKGNDFFLGSNDVVYAYENMPKPTVAGNLKGYTKESVYALVIKGTLSAKGEDVTRYWRINLIKADHYSFYRNSIYRLEIEKILTKGYDNPEDAETDPDGPPIIVDPDQTGVVSELSIKPWTIRTEITQI